MCRVEVSKVFGSVDYQVVLLSEGVSELHCHDHNSLPGEVAW